MATFSLHHESVQATAVSVALDASNKMHDIEIHLEELRGLLGVTARAEGVEESVRLALGALWTLVNSIQNETAVNREWFETFSERTGQKGNVSA